MVMAEAIAIAGVAVQFLDVSARLLSILSRFCQNLEHVPRQVRSTVQELTVFRHLVQVIDLDIRASNTGPVSTLSGALSPDHVILAISVLNQCITQAQELEDILQPLMPKASDHVLKKRWRAVASMRAEKEILDKWTQLQGLKTTLTLWYNHQTLVLLKDQGCEGSVRFSPS